MRCFDQQPLRRPWFVYQPKVQSLKHGDKFTGRGRVDELAHLTTAWIGQLLS
jgi:hypothetical protein